jgi:hypothetical protein
MKILFETDPNAHRPPLVDALQVATPFDSLFFHKWRFFNHRHGYPLETSRNLDFLFIGHIFPL